MNLTKSGSNIHAQIVLYLVTVLCDCTEICVNKVACPLVLQRSVTGGLGSIQAETMADTAVALASANVQLVSRKVIGRLCRVRIKVILWSVDHFSINFLVTISVLHPCSAFFLMLCVF